MTYVLWHTVRQGWVSNQGTTSTEFINAARMLQAEAIARCIRTKQHDGTLLTVPVPVDDLQEILA